MINAYEITIRDFEIELRNTEWWRFKKIKKINKQIDFYTELLEKEYDKKRRYIRK